RDAHRRERVRTTSAWLSIALAASLLAGCGTINSVLPSVSWPSWLGGSDSKKLGALPDIRATVTPKVLWQASIGKAQPGLAPAVTTDAVYVASLDGNLA